MRPVDEPVRLDGVAFTGVGKLVRKATGYEQEKLKPRYPTSGSRAARAELPADSSVSVTHRFLRRGSLFDCERDRAGEGGAAYIRIDGVIAVGPIGGDLESELVQAG